MSTESSWTVDLESGDEIDMKEQAYVRNPTERIRFWMPQSSDRTIIFLDEAPAFACWEHAFKIDGNFRNYATCLTHLPDGAGGKMECVACAAADGAKAPVSKYKIIPFSIIDRSSFTLKKGKDAGKTVTDQKRLFIAKNKTWEKLARRAANLAKEGKSLRGACFNVFRGADSQSASVGEDFEYAGHADLSKFADTKVYDYAEMLKPNPELVMRYMSRLTGMSGGDHDEGGVSTSAADEVFKK